MPKPVRYSYTYKVKVAWGEMDAFGHVNNVTYVRYFESARADYFTAMKIWDSPQKPLQAGPVLTHLDMDYRRQVVFPADLDVTLEVSSFSSRGFEIQTSMWNSENECVLTGEASFIWINFETGKPTSIPEVFQNQFAHLQRGRLGRV
jgi:acyl-CoA thioester hydrolase